LPYIYTVYVYVRVVDYATDGRPVFVPRELENVTVIEGKQATLVCRVYGDVSTRLQVTLYKMRSHVAINIKL